MSPNTERKNWIKEAMCRAVRVVRSGGTGYLRTSKYFSVPRGTLDRYVKDISRSPEKLVNIHLGRRTVLPSELENKLVKYCIIMDRRCYGPIRQDIKRMAFQLAIRYVLKHTFNQLKSEDGKKWLRTFLKRNPVISMRTPEGISAARVIGFISETVARLFDINGSELRKVNHPDHRIFGVDETGITTVQHRHSSQHEGKERNGFANVDSVVAGMNAIGTHVLP